MGGEGSGRKPDPLKQFFPQNKGKPTGMSFEPKTEIASDIYAPNYGAVKGARIKDFTDKLDDIYVNVSGDTMTGNLCMAGNSLFFDADCDSGFASIASPRANRPKSCASASAVPYRSAGFLRRHLRAIVSKSGGTRGFS